MDRPDLCGLRTDPLAISDPPDRTAEREVGNTARMTNSEVYGFYRRTGGCCLCTKSHRGTRN